MDIPILAIEYSLTPEAPFPRAIEEIFYVYCWVLKTGGKLLGTTAENILLVGDSAGANLTMAVLIKCIENEIPLPKGILSVYGLFLANYATIPSRMLGIFDVFLTHSMTVRIFKTYAGFFKKREIVKNEKIPLAPADEFDDKIPKDYLMSPIWTPDEILRQLPKVRLLTTEFDPLLDENIEMAKKLRRLNVDVKLDTLHDLVHGFLHLIRVRKML
jgi:hormone-sensitive lipase